jgi:hypothetical protein
MKAFKNLDPLYYQFIQFRDQDQTGYPLFGDLWSAVFECAAFRVYDTLESELGSKLDEKIQR